MNKSKTYLLKKKSNSVGFLCEEIEGFSELWYDFMVTYYPTSLVKPKDRSLRGALEGIYHYNERITNTADDIREQVFFEISCDEYSEKTLKWFTDTVERYTGVCLPQGD